MTAFDLPLDAAAAYVGVTILRATAVLIGAVVLAALLGRSSAAARHSLWSVTVCALVVLPLIQWAIPAISVPVPWLSHEGSTPTAPAPEHRLADIALPEPVGVEIQQAIADPAIRPMEGEPLLEPRASAALGVSPGGLGHDRANAALGVSQVNLENDLTGAGIRTRRVLTDPARLLLLFWLTGAAAMAAALCVGLWRSRLLRRGAARVTAPEWMESLALAAAAVGVTRTVTLHTSPAVRTAMTGGVLRPFLLLPEGAASWSAERRRIVLLHELVHVRRADAMRQVLGRVALSFYWFHPIAWYAVRMATLAREEACDEAVLALGQRPSVYARHLLDLAEPGPLPLPAISLFDRPQLEKRIMSILAFEAGRRCRRFVLIAPLLAVAWSVMAAAAVPAAPEGSPSVAAPITPAPHMEMTSGAMLQLTSPQDAGAEAHPSYLGLPPDEVASLFADAGWVVGPDGVMPPPSGSGEGAPVSLRALTSARDPDDNCLPMASGGFRTVPEGGADERVSVRRAGYLMICLWSRGAGSADNLANRIEALPSGADAVLAAVGARRNQRMVISAGPSGLTHTWTVDGVERPFDPAAREWRDAMLTIFDGYAEIDRLRAGEARARLQMTAARAEGATLQVQDAVRRMAESQVRIDTVTARVYEVALREQVAAIRDQQGLLRAANQVQSVNMEAMGAMATLSNRMRMLQMAQSATEDPVTRERLSAEIQSIEFALREQQEQLTGPPSDASQQELRRQMEEYQRERAAQAAELEAQLAELSAASRTVPVSRAQLQPVQMDVAATAEALHRRGLESTQRILELEERIEEAALRLQGSP